MNHFEPRNSWFPTLWDPEASFSKKLLAPRKPIRSYLTYQKVRIFLNFKHSSCPLFQNSSCQRFHLPERQFQGQYSRPASFQQAFGHLIPVSQLYIFQGEALAVFQKRVQNSEIWRRGAVKPDPLRHWHNGIWGPFFISGNFPASTALSSIA